MSRGYIIELAEERDDGSELVYFQKALVGASGGLKMYIYANEHPPPHFHVEFSGEENSFRIDNAEPLYPDNGLKRWFKNIRKWHKEHKQELIDAWNRMRPEDCPVGKIGC
jgi:hypothetical protein